MIPANDTIEGRDVTKKDYNTAVYRLGHFLSFQQFGEWAFRDLKETWWIIGIALIGACVLSFVWIVLIRILNLHGLNLHRVRLPWERGSPRLLQIQTLLFLPRH